jgi:hypothetical protein
VTDSILLKLSHTGKNFRNYEIKVSGRESRPSSLRQNERSNPSANFSTLSPVSDDPR